MIGFQAVQITIDFRRVRRINTTTNPVTRATQEVLDAMFAVHCRNWVILVCRFPLAHPSLIRMETDDAPFQSCTHVVIIAAVLNARTAMGGRPCASVSAVYRCVPHRTSLHYVALTQALARVSFCFLSQILQPQSVRRR